ncbi:MAG TPA: amylosucrase [Arachnia sp.]|nr:amylosucrase [Arachnia sp.]HMT87302.1 amylosucrase [Arachnia sp.]
MTNLKSEYSADQDLVRELAESRSGAFDRKFAARFDAHFPTLHSLFHDVYGDRADVREALAEVVALAAESWRARPAALKRLDQQREDDPTWFQSQKMLGAVCYVDRYAGSLKAMAKHVDYFKELGLTYLHLMPLFRSPEGNNDGGYAVSSYREVNPALGTMADLAALTGKLRRAGISPVVDFIFNHTASDHEWAQKAVAGDPDYEDFYLIFPDREMPDAYDQHTREIFPDDHPGSFVQLPDGRWIWSTFYGFQWDLNYANPAVFRAMAAEMLFLANQGVEVLRMDAVAFIWKKLGTTCESLPQAHLLLQAFNEVLRMAAPSLLFKSEAIVHPDEVIQYISPGECQLSYNPLQMALTWEALATRDVKLLNQALERRHALPAGTAWVNYVRSHDDIGWTFADEDAAEFGVDGYWHRRFLNDFYVGRFPGSFARGAAFQENPKTGDARVAGTTASLAGVEKGDPCGEDRVVLAHAVAMSTGGMPLLFLGDEVGQLNDYYYVNRPAEADDSRWVNRPYRPEGAYAVRGDQDTMSGRIFTRMTQLLQARREAPEFAGNDLIPFYTGHGSVLGFQRPGDETRILVLANFGDSSVYLDAERFAGFEDGATDLVSGEARRLDLGLLLPSHGFAWLRVSPRG